MNEINGSVENLSVIVEENDVLKSSKENRKLKRRSASGNIYQSTFEFKEASDSRDESALGANAHTIASVGNQSVNKQEVLIGAKRSEGNSIIEEEVIKETNLHAMETITTNSLVYVTNSVLSAGINSNNVNIDSHLLMMQRMQQDNMSQNLITSFTFANPLTTTSLPGHGIMSTQYSTPPQHIDANKVYSKLEEITRSLNTIQCDMRTLKDSKDVFTGQIESLQFKQETQEEKLREQGRELKKCQDKVGMLSNIAIRYEDEINRLNDKVEKLEAKMLRPNLTLIGIEESKQKTDQEQIKTFFSETLEITDEIKFHSVRRIGEGKNRPLSLVLTDPGKKGVIYANVSKLKDKKNQAGKPYFTNDHLPEETNEEQRRKRQIYADNKALPDAHQLPMSLQKGTLKVTGSVYRKKIKVSQNKELLQMNSDDLLQLQEIEALRGKEHREKGSIFVGYAIRATTLSEINKAYKHLKIKYGGASHLMMAYRLTGLNVAYDSDYIDDKEPGSGRRLLKMLQERKEEGLAVFAIRNYGGVHPGLRRFELILECAQEAIESLNANPGHTSKLSLKQTEEEESTVRRGKPQRRASTANEISRGRGAFAHCWRDMTTESTVQSETDYEDSDWDIGQNNAKLPRETW